MGAYRDRRHAGAVLAGSLASLPCDVPATVLALPRGGVPVAYAVAHSLHARLDLCLVRKIGTPGQEELAMGAVAEGGVTLVNRGLAARLGLSDADVARAVAAAEEGLGSLAARFRGGRAPVALHGRRAVLVDDGLATGATMRAAIVSAQRRGVEDVVVAVPVAPPDTVAALGAEVSRVVCPFQPEPLGAVGSAYDDFTQVDDGEVLALLDAAAAARMRPWPA